MQYFKLYDFRVSRLHILFFPIRKGITDGAKKVICPGEDRDRSPRHRMVRLGTVWVGERAQIDDETVDKNIRLFKKISRSRN